MPLDALLGGTINEQTKKPFLHPQNPYPILLYSTTLTFCLVFHVRFSRSRSMPWSSKGFVRTGWLDWNILLNLKMVSRVLVSSSAKELIQEVLNSIWWRLIFAKSPFVWYLTGAHKRMSNDCLIQAQTKAILLSPFSSSLGLAWSNINVVEETTNFFSSGGWEISFWIDSSCGLCSLVSNSFWFVFTTSCSKTIGCTMILLPLRL